MSVLTEKQKDLTWLYWNLQRQIAAILYEKLTIVTSLKRLSQLLSTQARKVDCLAYEL